MVPDSSRWFQMKEMIPDEKMVPNDEHINQLTRGNTFFFRNG